ncbi:MAG TPA: RHS repeat-associated core domain-containing protein, partial [Fermentimonas sp.]|nr:RHS repeat-associated core domain-containing protein [Fermentimonas sp.]
GNIQQLKQLGTNGFTRNFTYNTGGNTLQKVETPTPSLIEDFTYDTCGNQLTAGSTRNYVWNSGNQLITYYNQAGSSDPTIFAQYDYDGGGNRVSKLIRTGSAGSPIYERTIYIDGVFEYHILENGTTYEKNYVHVMDDTSRIAMVRIGDQFPDDIADAVTYNLEDQIGSSSIRLNTSGGIIDKEEYYPFGDSSLRTFSKKRYRYVGKEKDLESGLYYYGARYYAAWTCRFVSVDPLAGDYPFYTPYNYAGNKPVNKVDIDGMQEEGAISSKEYTTPDGGTMTLPSNSSVELFDNRNTHLIDGKEVSIADKSVKSFVYNNITYNAMFSKKTGKFTRYLGDDGSVLSYSTNTLASVSNSGEYWGGHLATAGIIAVSDGPEPFIMDAVALVYIIGISIGAIWAIDNLRDYVSTQAPSIPIGGYVSDNVSDYPAIPVSYPVDITLPDTFTGDPPVDYFVHYTDDAGLAGIVGSQVIFPNEKGKVYLTQSMLTPEEVEMILFAGFGTHEGRGKNMIIFYVTASQRAMIVKDFANIHEYYYVGGSLRISGQILYSGPNINN